MAKKKTETEDIKLDDYMARLKGEFDKEFGEQVFRTGQDVLNKKATIIKWTPALDLILGGGVPTGSFISVSGKPKTGKSSFLLYLAAKAQKENIPCFYLDVEGRLKHMNLNGIKGLDLSPEKFRVVKSTQDKILTTQDFLKIGEKILKMHPRCMIIIDSMSCLTDEKEMTGGLGTETRGHNNKVISQFISLVGQLVSATDSIVAGINHIIANTSGFGASTVEKTSNRWIYQADIQLRIQYTKELKKGGEGSDIIGQTVFWKCNTSALGKPFGTCEAKLRFGYGPDELAELIDLGTSCGLIAQAGSWFKMEFLHNEFPEFSTVEQCPKRQGAEQLWEFLSEKPEYAAILEKKLSSFAGELIKSEGGE